jgi:hypothetical protein
MKSHVLHALRSAMLSLCLLVAVFFANSAYGQIVELRVHGDEGLAIQEGANGASWDTAYKYLQGALAHAHDLLSDPIDPPDTVEIWVAATDPENPYRPDRCSEWHTFFENNSSTCSLPFGHLTQPDLHCSGRSFYLQNNVEILGGFPIDSPNETIYGPGGATKADRNWLLHVTVLSGDLYEDDFESHELDFDPRAINQPRGGSPCGAALGTDGRAERHAARVVGGDDDDADAHDRVRFQSTVVHAAAYISQTAVIDGFIIRTSRGHAMVIDDAQPRVSNCTFQSGSDHAAVRLRGNAEVVFSRCTFEIIHGETIAADDAARFWCVE